MICAINSPTAPFRLSLHMCLLSWLNDLQENKHKGSGAWLNMFHYFRHTPFKEADVRWIRSATYNHSAIMSDCFTNCFPPFLFSHFLLTEADVNGIVCVRERESAREKKTELSQVTLSFRNPEGLADSRLQHGHHKSMGEGAKLIAWHLWRRKALNYAKSFTSPLWIWSDERSGTRKRGGGDSTCGPWTKFTCNDFVTLISKLDCGQIWICCLGSNY